MTSHDIVFFIFYETISVGEKVEREMVHRAEGSGVSSHQSWTSGPQGAAHYFRKEARLLGRVGKRYHTGNVYYCQTIFGLCLHSLNSPNSAKVIRRKIYCLFTLTISKLCKLFDHVTMS